MVNFQTKAMLLGKIKILYEAEIPSEIKTVISDDMLEVAKTLNIVFVNIVLKEYSL